VPSNKRSVQEWRNWNALMPSWSGLASSAWRSPVADLKGFEDRSSSRRRLGRGGVSSRNSEVIHAGLLLSGWLFESRPLASSDAGASMTMRVASPSTPGTRS